MNTLKQQRFSIVDKDITIHYNLEDTSIELYGSTSEHISFEFRILDVEIDKRTGSTTIQCSDLNDIKLIIDDFMQKFNKLRE